MMKIAIGSPDPEVAAVLGPLFKRRGDEWLEMSDLQSLLDGAAGFQPHIVFLDQHFLNDNPSINPRLVSSRTGAKVFVVSAENDLDQAVMMMRRGAEYYCLKPLDVEQIALLMENAEESLPVETPVPGGLVGDSPAMIGIRRMISLLARNTTPVLVLGESGTGKELVARAIHEEWAPGAPLIEINCASLSENLLEMELFGYEKGAFTDAKSVKKGLFEVASAGTIFFDELGEMPLATQAKLLKVLDSRRFRRIGGITEIRTGARFMAATNADLERLVAEGRFREDLYYRVNVLPVRIPPLRERPDDIPLLVRHFLRNPGIGAGRRSSVSDSAMAALCSYRWRGNVRELRNVIERALILSEDGEVNPEHLPPEVVRTPTPAFPPRDFPLKPLWSVELDYIRAVLEKVAWNQTRAASILGISRSTLILKLRKYGLSENRTPSEIAADRS